jgi:hypothetical protein
MTKQLRTREIEHAIRDLKNARNMLRQQGCAKAAIEVSVALKSAEDALRHAQLMEGRAGR